ncbi:MAG: hypothetical protein KDB14_05915 [Planctomycetales bacterium]|nr:hypothetical protein [Planctomycetales bacterium]
MRPLHIFHRGLTQFHTIAWLLWLAVVSQSAAALETRDVVIVAGQSNAVGFDANPDTLPPSPWDKQVRFWWRCGDPPPDTHDSTSNGWTHLQAQPLGATREKSSAPRQYGNFAQANGGFGPEIGMARELAAGGDSLAVIKVAFSGTSLDQDWRPGVAAPDDEAAQFGQQPSSTPGDCYRRLLAEVRAAIAAAKQEDVALRIRAFAWVQGESDAKPELAERYGSAMQQMIAALRRDLDAPQMAVLLAVNARYSGGSNPHLPEVIRQQQKVANADPLCSYVDTSSASIANRVHYDGPGTLAVGSMFAQALQNIESRSATQSLRIVALGDSITKGVRSGVATEQTFASLLQAGLVDGGQQATVANVGIGGERTDQALKRLDQVIALKPDVVTIMYGTNDSYVDAGKQDSRISVAAYRRNLDEITAKLIRHGIRPVLMTPPRWSLQARPNGLNENPNVKLEPYVVACREAADFWAVPLVDHFRHWTDAQTDGVTLHDWTTDGCHPNPAGHAKLAERILPVLKQLQSRSTPTDSTAGSTAKPTVQERLRAGKPVRVVCFGDSVTGVYYHTGSRRAYTDLLKLALDRYCGAECEAINAGISGHTTVNALARIEQDVLAKQPDVVTVMFGLNDMARVPLETYRENLREIVARCRAVGAEVVLATPNNVLTTSGRPTEKLRQYCQVVREVSQELSTGLCDCYQAFDAIRAGSEDRWSALMSDAIHPNLAGHRQIAVALASSITGQRIRLDVTPLPGAQRVRERLSDAASPVKIWGMGAMTGLLKQAIDEHAASQRPALQVQVDVSEWETQGASLPEIREQAKAARQLKPDLVLIALPRNVPAVSAAEVRTSYEWIINNALNFGSPTWDVVVVHPEVFESEPTQPPAGMTTEAYDAMVRDLAIAHDLTIVDRPAGSSDAAADLMRAWLSEQWTR